MINVILAGVGGQGTVLAAKMLASAAANKGWHVRTAETIGMAQRGGSVVSHVRMGNRGEEVYAPLVPKGMADLIVAFEPGEAARNLNYLSRSGTLVTASSTVEPVSASLDAQPYDSAGILEGIQLSIYNTVVKSLTRGKRAAHQPSFIPIDDTKIIRELGGDRRVLNTVMLASALSSQCIPLTVDDLRSALGSCVRSEFLELNLNAIECAIRMNTASPAKRPQS